MEKYFIQGKILRKVEIKQMTYEDGSPHHIEIRIEGISRPIFILSDEDGHVDVMMTFNQGVDLMTLDHVNEVLPKDKREIAMLKLQDSGRLS